jgi:hypothetical protein
MKNLYIGILVLAFLVGIGIVSRVHAQTSTTTAATTTTTTTTTTTATTTGGGGERAA